MKKLKTLDKVLIILGAFLFCFIVASITIYTIKDWPFDTLISMVLGGGGIEIVATAVIQIAKYKNNQNRGEKEDEIDECN